MYPSIIFTPYFRSKPCSDKKVMRWFNSTVSPRAQSSLKALKRSAWSSLSGCALRAARTSSSRTTTLAIVSSDAWYATMMPWCFLRATP